MRLANENLGILLQLVLLLLFGGVRRARYHTLADVHIQRRRVPTKLAFVRWPVLTGESLHSFEASLYAHFCSYIRLSFLS